MYLMTQRFCKRRLANKLQTSKCRDHTSSKSSIVSGGTGAEAEEGNWGFLFQFSSLCPLVGSRDFTVLVRSQKLDEQAEAS